MLHKHTAPLAVISWEGDNSSEGIFGSPYMDIGYSV